MLFILQTFLELLICIFSVFCRSEQTRIFDIPRDNWSGGDYFMILYACTTVLTVTFSSMVFLAYFFKYAPYVFKNYKLSKEYHRS